MHRFSALLTAATILAVALVGLWGPADLRAQESSSSKTDQLIDGFDQDRNRPESGEDQTETGLPERSVSRVNLDLRWRNWKNSVTEGEPDPDQLAQLVENTRGFGYRNAAAYATASSRVLDANGGELSLSSAAEAYHTIEELAPDLPSTHLTEARFFARHHPMALEHLFGAYSDGLVRALNWPNTRALLAGYGWLALLVLAAAGSVVVIVGQIIRHLPIVTHDIALLLPSAITRGQIVAAILLGAAALLMWTKSLLIATLALLAIASISQAWNERLVTMAAALAIATIPYVESQLVELGSFSGSQTQTLLEAQYVRCDQDCLDELEASFESDDPGFRYTAALAILRGATEAPRDRAVSILTSDDVPDDLRGNFANLRGAARLAVGQPDEAIETLKVATDHMEDPTAAWFNLMRAYRKAGDDEHASDASKQASRLDVETVRRKSNFDREDPASHLILPPLPESYFRTRHRSADIDTGDATILGGAWSRVAGPRFEVSDATYLGAGTFGALLLLSVFSILGLVSTPCPNCGLAREPEDIDSTAGHPHCLPCYRTFVGGAELDYKARVHYETLLGRRSTAQMILRRFLSVVLPGAGHALAGRALSGFVLAGALGVGLYLVVTPDWLWEPTRSNAGIDFLGAGYAGWLLVAIGLLIALGSAWRDIEPIELDVDLDGDEEAT